MKKFVNLFVVLLILIAGFSFASTAQIIVKVRPVAPRAVVRIAAPTPHHIWIDGGWVVRGGTYVWSDGYWALPSYPGHSWVPAH